MNRYQLHATLLSPVVVKRDRQSQRSEGATSLSGSVLRGALAALYLQACGEPDEEFRRLFLDESACRFGPLDPAPHTLPVTAVSCKRHPGFLADWGAHGVADQLWSRIASELAGAEVRVPGVPEKCANCREKSQHDLKPFAGFWLEDEGGPRSPVEVRRRLNMHVGIDRATHTAAETILYSLEALEPVGEETRLFGWLDVDDRARARLEALLEENDREVRVGHARARGYGRVRLGQLSAAEKGRSTWDRWSTELLAFLGRPGLPGLNPGQHFFFSLSLPAGAVLVDELLRTTLDPADLTPWLPPLPPPVPVVPALEREAMPALEGGTLRCVAAVAHHERLRGWNAAHGLPRQDEWAVTRGAVYAYLFEGDARARAALQERLARLEREGVGARRNEGLGRVVVSDDFHRRFHRQQTEGKHS
jgi:CRISPR-associated Csx10 family RAMP protein